METKYTRKSVLLLLALFAMLFVTAQANLDFNKYTLVSGADRQQGAEYRFSSVQEGVDALVTIRKLTRSASLGSFGLSRLGSAEALQPELSVIGRCWGYVEFNIQYVIAGSSTPVALMDIPVKGKNYGSYNGNDKDVKLYVFKNSATSFKVIMYMANFNSRTLTRKADVFLHKDRYEDMAPSETKVSFASSGTGN